MQSNTSARPGGLGPVQSSTPLERELPMLAGIGAFITWCEDLLGLLSGPILTAGLAIALVDLLSNNALFSRVPTLLWVWACSMALGLDAQFIGSAAKAAKAIRQRRPWAATGYFILCGALGYVGFIASNVLATQEANGITTAEALARLGLDSTNWIVQRSVLAVVLVFLSGFLRYVAPGKNVATSTAEERERLEAEIELAPLRARLRAQQARGMRGTVAAALGRENQQQPAAGHTVKPRIVVASSTLADPQPTAHQESAVSTYKNEHDIDWVDLPEGVTDEVEYDESIYSTQTLPESRKSRPSLPNRTPNSSGTRRRESYDFDGMLDDDEMGDSYPNSRHQRKNGKTAVGRMNQRQRKAELARQSMERQEAKARDHVIDRAVDIVMAEITETGEELSGYQLEDRVNEALERMGSSVHTSRKTVDKKKHIWLAQHDAKAIPVVADESDELPELQGVW